MRNRLIFTTIFLLFFTFSSPGQKLVNSPFARYNLGIMEPAGSFKSLGMGGVGVALRDHSSVFISNPASYSSIDTNSFVFDFGIDYSMNFLSDGKSRYFSDDTNFDHILLGFPIAKGLGMVTGLIPFSSGYYQMSTIVTKNDPGYDPVTGEFSVFHTGEGGLTTFFAGTGVNIHRNLSAGVNMNVLFGKITRDNRFIFNDYENALHNNSTEMLQVSGINFDFGIQYFSPVREDFYFNAGLSVTTGKKYRSTYENFSYLYSAYSTVDTLIFTSSGNEKTQMPLIYRAGLAFGKKNKFVIGADFVAANWSKGRIPGYEGYLADTRSLLIGTEYIPDKYSNFNIARRFEYRLGGHISNSYLLFEGEKIKEIGISAGLGVPMRRSLSRTNIFLDYTRKGNTKSEGMHAENYFTVGISLNLYDFWFIQRKYD